MKKRTTWSLLVLTALVALLVWRLLLIDVDDLRVEIVEEPEPVPVNYAELAAGHEEDLARQERNRHPHWKNGKWQVEANFDHEAHWRWQMQVLEELEYSHLSLSPSTVGRVDGQAAGDREACPNIRANAADAVGLNVTPREQLLPGRRRADER